MSAPLTLGWQCSCCRGHTAKLSTPNATSSRAAACAPLEDSGHKGAPVLMRDLACCAVQQVTLLTTVLSGCTREPGSQCPLMVTQAQVCVQDRVGQHVLACRLADPSGEQDLQSVMCWCYAWVRRPDAIEPGMPCAAFFLRAALCCRPP